MRHSSIQSVGGCCCSSASAHSVLDSPCTRRVGSAGASCKCRATSVDQVAYRNHLRLCIPTIQPCHTRIGQPLVCVCVMAKAFMSGPGVAAGWRACTSCTAADAGSAKVQARHYQRQTRGHCIPPSPSLHLLRLGTLIIPPHRNSNSTNQLLVLVGMVCGRNAHLITSSHSPAR